MVHEDFKVLPKRTAPDKKLREKAFNLHVNPKYDGYKRGLVSMIYKCFDKKSSGVAIVSKQELSRKYTHLLKMVFGMLIYQIRN